MTNTVFLPVPDGLTNVIEVAAGIFHFTALHEDGRVTAWGTNDQGQLNVPPGLSGVTAIAAGRAHVVALRADGSVAAWGDNSQGQATVPTGITNATAVGAYHNTSYASLADGRTIVWGLESTLVPSSAISNVLFMVDAFNYVLTISSEGVGFLRTTSYHIAIDDITGLTGIVAASRSTSGISFSLLLRDGSITNLTWVGSGVQRHPGGFVQVVEAHRGFGLSRDGTVTMWAGFSKGNTLAWLPSNVAHVATSSSVVAAIVSEDGAPLMTVHPASRSAYKGSTTRFESRSFGLNTKFQWEKDGVALTGETNEFLELRQIEETNAGMYRVRVSNDNGSVASRPAGLAVLDAAPQFVQEPASTNTCVGGEANLLALTTGSLPQFFTWYSNGVPFLTSDTGPLNLRNVQFKDSADYHVVVTNYLGTATSHVARVRVVNVYYNYLFDAKSVYPEDLTNAVQCSGGGRHAVALRGDGTVRVWGSSEPAITNIPAGLSNVVQVAAGGAHTLALKSDGTVVSWGTNSIANVPFDATWVPAEATSVISIAASFQGGLALRVDGSLIRWGDMPALAIPSSGPKSRVVAISAGGAYGFSGCAAVVADGTIITSGNPNSQHPATNVVGVSGGAMTMLATLQPDGKLTAWSGSVPQSNVGSNVVAIDGRSLRFSFVAYGIQDNGRLIEAITPLGYRTLPTNPPLAVDVSSWYDALVVVATKSLHMPQYIPPVQAYTGTPARLFVPVIAPMGAKLQWFHEGEMIAGATNRFLEVPDPQHGARYTLLAEAPDGARATAELQVVTIAGAPLARSQSSALMGAPKSTVELSGVAWASGPMFYQWSRDGVLMPGQTNSVLRLTNLAYSDAGIYLLRASNVLGTIDFVPMPLSVSPVFGWGVTAATNIPSGLRHVVSLSADDGVCVAVHQDGHVTAWGDPARFTDTPLWWQNLSMDGVAAVAVAHKDLIALQTNGVVPGMPLTPNKAVAVAKGYSHSLALLPDGTVFAWGDNSQGQTNVPAGLTNVIAISARNNQSLALRADGTVVGWGSDGFGRSTVPVGLSNVVAISAGYTHSLAVLSDGRVVEWGTSNCRLSPANKVNEGALTASAGDLVNIAVLTNGSAVSWGCFIPAAPTLGGVDDVVASPNDVFALIRDVPEPPVRISDVTFSDGEIVFEVPTELARSYIVERCSELATGSWTVGGGLAGDGTTRTVTIPRSTQDAEFFRVRRN